MSDGRPIERRATVAIEQMLVTALRSPERLARSAPDVIAAALRAPGAENARILGLRTLAALAYARPDLLRPAIVGPLASVMADPVSAPVAMAVADAFQCLVVSAAGPPAARAIIRLLGRGLSRHARGALLLALRSYAEWRPRLISLDAALLAVQGTPGPKSQGVILREVIERRVFAAPHQFSEDRVRRLIATVGDRARLRYTLAALAEHRGVPRAARARARRWLARRSSRGRSARDVLERLRAVVVIHNVDDGQGDEIVRVAPIVQALLDVNPLLRVTTLTKRVYLYDHPRVTPASILDAEAVERALGADAEGLIDFNVAAIPAPSFLPGLAQRVTEHLGARQLSVVIRGVTGRRHFSYDTVEVGGRLLAAPLGLDRVEVDNAYDATERLLVELGLRRRAGRDAPRAGSLFTAAPSGEARAAWRSLSRHFRRKVALVNPFGGQGRLKGFTLDKAARLAAELGSLVDEGFDVVLLASARPWAGPEMIAATLGHLDRARRAHLAVATDPPGAGGVLDHAAHAERPDVAPADRVMRRFKYFAVYADLIVTVEGWLMHLAYALGRPFRVLLAPHSSVSSWLPCGRGPDQQLVTAMSPLSPPDVGDLLGDDDPPPAPFHPRKAMLMAALRGLEHVRGPDAARLVRKALTSPDLDLRAVTLEILGRCGPAAHVKERLLAALADSAAPVRSAAARALLEADIDCKAELGPAYRDQLCAHVAIARQDWPTISMLGLPVLPALAAAASDGDDTIRREARWVAATLVAHRAPAVLANRNI
jgi:hypothetical protein